MKYIKSIPDKDELLEIEDFLYKNYLPSMCRIEANEQIKVKKIANFVYEKCKDFIPEDFLNLLETLDEKRGEKNYLKFKEDLIENLILSAKIRYKYNRETKEDSYIKSNDKKMKEFINNLNLINKYDYEYNIDSRRSYLSNLDNRVCDFFGLTKSTKENKANNRKNATITHLEMPVIIDNFLMYIAVKYNEFHDNWMKSNLVNSKAVEDYADEYIKIINKLSNNKDIELYMFERVYNIKVIEEILKNTKYYNKDDDLNKVYKHLALVSLLPNVNSRAEYIKLFIQNSKILARKEDANGNGYGYGNPFMNYETGVNTWLNVVDNIILGMALITIPIMEEYFYYLLMQSTEAITELESYEEIAMNVEVNELKIDNIDDFNLLLSRINNIVKVYDEEKMEDAFYSLDFDFSKTVLEENVDEYIKLIDTLPENKIEKIIAEYKKNFL